MHTFSLSWYFLQHHLKEIQIWVISESLCQVMHILYIDFSDPDQFQGHNIGILD